MPHAAPKINSPEKQPNKSTRPLLYYFILLALFIGFVWFVATYITPLLDASGLELTKQGSTFNAFAQGVKHHVGSSLGLLLLQVIIILIVARIIGRLFSKIKQPTVIGEIVAGILLGPTLLGAVSPNLFSTLFPEWSIASLELLSNFGLILFMFTIGMELRLSDIRSQARDALIISQSSIFIPFMLGMGVAIFLYGKYAPHVPFFPMALFMGIAMSITAFPVLARIIQERQMNRTPFGKLTLNSAAAGDIVAWLMLAAIMAVSQSGSFLVALYNLLFLVIYLAIMFGIVRPIFKLVGKVYNKEELVTKSLVGLIFILLLTSAYFTEILSMHALFGAFMLGLIMPEDIRFRDVITEKVEDVSLNIFLPLFFVSSGLKTDLTLINNWGMALLALLMIVIAIIGKVGGTYIAARICGIKQKESLYLGAYMNTRGLMELVVLKIGLDLGILPPLLFAILVLMTVVTTVMTAPMIHFIDWVQYQRERKRFRNDVVVEGKILISFGRPETGIALLRLAKLIFPNDNLQQGVIVLHATINSSVSTIDEERYFSDNFTPIQQEADKLNIPIIPIYSITDNVATRIIDETSHSEYNYLLLGSGLQLSSRKSDQEIVSLRRNLRMKLYRLTLGGINRKYKASQLLNENMIRVTEQAPTNVGVLIARPFSTPKHIVVAISPHEQYNITSPAKQMALATNGIVSILPLALPLNTKYKNTLAPDNYSIADVYKQEDLPRLSMLDGNRWPAKCDFLFLSYETWNLLSEHAPKLIESLPPALIVRGKHAKKELSSSLQAKRVPFE